MKRTNLVLDEDVLNEAVTVLGVKTYSTAVNQALKEAIRVKKARGILQFHGSNLWEGDLAEMRGDSQAAKARSARPGR